LGIIIGAPVLVNVAVTGTLFISQLRGELNVIKRINGEGTKDIVGRMTLKDVETLLQEDGKAWSELYAVLEPTRM